MIIIYIYIHIHVRLVQNCESCNGLRWLGHLARMLDERLPKGVLVGHMDGSTVQGRS